MFECCYQAFLEPSNGYAQLFWQPIYNLLHVKYEHFLYERQIVLVLDHTQ